MAVQTIVGVNPWVAHANTSVFGADADEFRPERWLEADQASANRMEQYFFTVSSSPLCTFRYPPLHLNCLGILSKKPPTNPENSSAAGPVPVSERASL